MGQLTVLDYIRRHSARSNLPPPNSVVASADANVIQQLGTLNEFGEDLQTRRRAWFDASFWFDPTAGDAPVQYITKDTNRCVVPDAVVNAWMAWKWKSKKGLEYAEDFAQYERLVGMYIDKLFPGEVIDTGQGPANAYDVITPSLNQRPWGVRRW